MLWVVRKTARDNLARLMALHNCSLTPERETYQSVCVCEREREREKESVRAQRLNHFAKSILRFAEQQLDPVVGAANSKMLYLAKWLRREGSSVYACVISTAVVMDYSAYRAARRGIEPR